MHSIRTARLGPEPLTRVLVDVALARDLVALIDVPALERTSLARLDSAMIAAVEALCRAKVQVVLIAPHERELLERIHRELPLAWCLDPADAHSTLAHVRERVSWSPVLAISDDPALLAGLSARDRGLDLGCNAAGGMGNVVRMCDLNVRATLWWLVYMRTDAGLAV
jgi:hypothetical protein